MADNKIEKVSLWAIIQDLLFLGLLSAVVIFFQFGLKNDPNLIEPFQSWTKLFPLSFPVSLAYIFGLLSIGTREIPSRVKHFFIIVFVITLFHLLLVWFSRSPSNDLSYLPNYSFAIFSLIICERLSYLALLKFKNLVIVKNNLKRAIMATVFFILCLFIFAFIGFFSIPLLCFFITLGYVGAGIIGKPNGSSFILYLGIATTSITAESFISLLVTIIWIVTLACFLFWEKRLRNALVISKKLILNSCVTLLLWFFVFHFLLKMPFFYGFLGALAVSSIILGLRNKSIHKRYLFLLVFVLSLVLNIRTDLHSGGFIIIFILGFIISYLSTRISSFFFKLVQKGVISK